MKVLADTFYIENGNIGIGTTEPRQLLDINYGQIILNNGNLGIGTDYAQQSLHVVGPSLLNGPITTNSNSVFVGIGSVYADGFYGSNATIHKIFAANVGIGTTYAKESLHVYGNIFTHGIITTCNLTVLGDTIIFDTITSNTDQMVITNIGSGPALIVRQEGDEPVAEFYDNESGIALYVGNNGNIGIGTMLPLHKLSVYGDTFLNGFITTNDNSINAGSGSITASQFIGTASKVAYDLVPGYYILGSNYNGLTSQRWDIHASSNMIPTTLVSRDIKGAIYTANVGINTSIATNALTVYGSSLLYGSIDTSNQNINVGTGSVTAANFYGTATAVSQSLTPGNYIVGNAYDGSSPETWTLYASSNNIPSTLVSRDANNTIFISNIGIGTTNIIDALNVSGKSILNGFVTTCNNDLDVGSGTLYVNTLQNNELYTANIGIGTSITRDVLDVEGYARTTLGYKVNNREIINANGNMAWSNLIFYPFVDAGTGISGGGNLTSNITISVDSTVVRTVGAYTLTGAIGMTAGLNMNNTNITNVNNIAISDPGPNEGISWTGGNLWKIYESPDSGANTAGDLQFVTGTHQRKFTIYTTGDARVQQTLFTSNVIADSNITTPYLVVQQEALFQGPIYTTCNIQLNGSTLYATAVGIGTTFTNVPLRVDGTTVLNGFVTTCNNDLTIGTGTLTGSYFTGTANKVGQFLTPSHYIVGTDYDGSSAITWSIYGFSNVTPSSLVARDALGNTYFGNVGIGTAVATHTLTVEGMSIFNGYINTLNNSINAGTGTVTAAIFAGTATNVSQSLTPGDYIVGSNYDGGVARTWTLYARSNSVPNSIVARDATAGIYACNVGIGTVLAPDPLTVYGNSILNGSVNTCNNTIYVGSGSVYATNFFGTATQVSQLLTPGDYIVGNAYNGSNAETWTLYASSNILPSTIVARDQFSNIYAANIGIGTTTVQVAFEVYSTDSMLLPKGDISERPSGVKGYVRYNTELDQFEGFGAGNAWGSLGGVKSTDQQTYITADNSSNITFYTAGQLQAILNSNGNLGIGTNDPIVSLHINRTDSILLPKGDTTQRPDGVTGLIRYNTDLNQFEGFGAGNAWGSLGGVKSTDQQTYITADNNSNISFYTAGQLRAIMNSNGNLGLGTENPIYPFYINNTTHSKVGYTDVSIPNQLLEHPPSSLTSNTTTLLNQAYGNGSYYVTASSINSNISEIYHAFDEGGLSWFSLSTLDSYYDANNNYVGSNSIVPGYYGEWIKIELPESIIVTTYSLFTTALAGVRHPRNYKLYGSEDDINWTVLDTQTNITTNVGTYVVSFSNTSLYKYYAIVINKNNGPYNNAVITEWKLYGTSSTNASGFVFTNSNSVHASILSERQNTLLSYAINAPYRNQRDSSRPGALVSINTETDGLFGDYENYSIKTYPKNTSNEIPAFVIDLNTHKTYLAGNVGIGSTEPSQKLDVIGNIRASGDIIAANIQSLNITSNQQVVIHNLGTPPALKVIQTGFSNSAEFYNNGTLAVSIGSNYKLSVQGDSLFTGTIYACNETVYASYFKGTASKVEHSLLSDSTAYLYGNTYDGSSPAQWGVFGSISNVPNYLVARDSSMSIYVSNIGIRTYDITHPLTVNGSSFLDGPISTNSNNIDVGTGSVTAQNFYGTATAVSQSLDPGNYILGASYTGSSNITWNINATSSNIPNTLVARDSSGKSYLNFVGIGTDYTTEKLYIEGDVFANGTIRASNLVILGDSVVLNTTTSNTEQLIITNNGTGPALIVRQSGVQPIAEFYDNESGTALHIGNDGTVGIGTNLSTYKLTVQGDTLILGTLITSNNNIQVGTGSVTAQNFYGTATQVGQSLDPGTYILGASYTGSSNITWNINAATTSTPNTLVARDANADLYSQKVGINTTSTSHFLTVYGTTLLNGAVATNSNSIDVGTGSVTAQNFYGTATRVSQSLQPGNYILGASYTGSSNITWNINASTSAIANTLVARDATASIYISNVGIGTTIARSPLDVTTTIRTSNLVATSSIYSATQFLGNIGTASVPSYSWVNDPNTGVFNPIADSIALTVGGSEKVRLISSGNVGIGTTNPLYSLHIQSTDSLLIPKGNSAQRPSGTSGLIRYNTELSRFEGYGTTWAALGGAAGSTITSDDGYTIVQVSDNGNTTFTNDSVQNAVLTGDGNLGIGITTPAQKLHVNGSAIVANTLYTSNLVLYNSIQYDSLNPALMFDFEIKPTRYTEKINSLTGKSNFTIPVLGLFDVIPENVHIYHNGFKLGYLTSNVNDYTISYSYSNSIPVYTVVDVTLKQLVYNNSVIDIQVYPKTLTPGQIGMVVQDISYNYWKLSLPNNNSNIYWNSGNVGIGIATPSVSLHVNKNDAIIVPAGTTAQRPGTTPGSIRYNTELGTFEGYSTEWGPIGGGNAEYIETVGFTSVTTSNDNYIRFSTTNTLQAVIDPTGNVGIGTSIPQEKLHVEGNAIISNTLYTSNIVLYNNLLFPQSDASTYNLKYAIQPTVYTEEVTSTPSGKSNFTVVIPGVVGIEPENTYVYLNGYKLAYIDALNNDYSISYTAYTSNTTVLVTLNQLANDTDIIDIIIHPVTVSSNLNNYLIQNVNLTSLWNQSSSPANIYYGGGYVGIGTSAPQDTLHVSGNMLIAGHILPSACNLYNIGSLNYRFKDLYLSGNTIDLGGTLISRNETTGQLVVQTPSGQPVDISTNTVSASNISIIDNTLVTQNGNVGIGTANPTQKLHVQGNAYISGSLSASNLTIFGDFVTLTTVTSNTEQLFITNAGTGPALKVSQTGNTPLAEFYDNESGTALFIDNNGLIGFSTNAPLAKLHILEIGSTDAFRVDDQTTDTTPFIIKSDGNVGIGTHSPRSTLEVNGTILPSACNVYNIGSESLRIKGLYLGDTGTVINNYTISNTSNDLMVNNRVSLYKSRISVQRALEQTPGGRNPFDCFVFIDSDDNVRTIGLNTESSFGTAGTDVYAPGYCTCLPNQQKASKVYKTRYNMFIISENSNVYATGNNGNGNCALPAGSGIADVIKPTLTAISNCSKVIQSTSINFSVSAMFLTYDGKVYSVGFNQYGQLGINSTTESGNTGPKLTLGPGNTYGNPTDPVLDVIGLGGYDGTNWPETYCALMSTGTVRCVGYGGNGQMGNGTTTATNSTWKLVEIGVGQGLSNITNIYCAGYHGGTSFYALNTSNELYAWGYNLQGQLALGNTTTTTRATKISTAAVNSNVEAVYPFNSGYASIIVKTFDGNWYGSGYNGVGQLGLGDTTNRSSFTLITSLQNKNIDKIYYTGGANESQVFAKEKGTNRIYAAGHNVQGQLANYATSTALSTFTEIPFNINSSIIDIIPIITDGLGGYTIILTEDGNTYFAGQSRWGYAGHTNRNVLTFCKNTYYLTGG